MSKPVKRPTWSVYISLPGALRATVEVEADYFRIDGGDAIFRNVGAAGLYPEVVRVFARGHWQEIVRAK